MRVFIGYIGEIDGLIYATPISTQIKNDFENAHISWGIKQSHKIILENNPNIDELIFIDNENKIDGVDLSKWANEKYNESKFDEVIISQLDFNLQNYDSTLRTSILSSYKNKYTIDLSPELYLSETEFDKIQDYISINQLFKNKYNIIIDFEYINASDSETLINGIFDLLPNAQILSSNLINTIKSKEKTIDLTDFNLKEIAFLSNHCFLFIGYHSTISKVIESNLGKNIPKILIYDRINYFDSLANDYIYREILNEHLIEINQFSISKILGIIESIIEFGTLSTIDLFHEKIKINYDSYSDKISENIKITGDIDFALHSLFCTIKRNGWNSQLYDFVSKNFIKNSIFENDKLSELESSMNNYLKLGETGISKEKIYMKNLDDNANFDNDLFNLIAFGESEILEDDKNESDFNYLDLLDDSNNEEYLITAIVSVYNSRKFIEGCLDDLVNQTIFEKTEVIIVDSNSPQNEFSIIENYTKKYKNIKYIRTENRETVYQSWNRAIKIATGKYLTNANTDDRHRKDAFEILTNLLEENDNIGIVYADSLITTKENDTFETTETLRKFEWLGFNPGTAITTSIFGPQPVWRKSVHNVVGIFNENYKIAADYDLFTRVAISFGALYLNETLGIFYQNNNTISGTTSKIDIIKEIDLIKSEFKNDFKIEVIFPEIDLFSDEEKSIAYFTWANAVAFGPYTDFNEASKYYEKSIEKANINPEFYKEFSKLIKNNLGLLLVKLDKNEDAKKIWQSNIDFVDTQNNIEILNQIESGSKEMSLEHLIPSRLRNKILENAQRSIIVNLDEDQNFIYRTSIRDFYDVYNGPDGINITKEDLELIKNSKPSKLRIENYYYLGALVSTYNSEKFIQSKIDNLLEQTISENLQIIIVNSGSQENEHKIIIENLLKNNNIFYLKTKNRETVYKAWNRGIKISNSKYLTNSNTDDKVREDGYELMIRALEQYPEYYMIYSDCFISKDFENSFKNNNTKIKYLMPDSNLGIFLSASCFGAGPLWKTEVHKKIGYFNENYEIAADYDFFLTISENFPVIHLREPLLIFLQRENSISGKDNLIKSANEIADICNRHRDKTELKTLYNGLENFENDIYSLSSVIVDYANLWILSAYGNFDKASMIIQNLLELIKTDFTLSEEIKRIVKNNLSVYFFCVREYDLAFDYISSIKDDEIIKFNYEKMLVSKQNNVTVFPDDFVILDLPSDLLDKSRECSYLSIKDNEILKGRSYRRFWDTFFGIDGVQNSVDYLEYDMRFSKEKDYKFNSETSNISSKKKVFSKKVLFTMFGWNESGGGTQFPRELALSLVNMGWEVCIFYAGLKHSEINTPYYFEKKTENKIKLFGVFNRKIDFINIENPLLEIEDSKITELFNDCLNEFEPDLIHFHNFLGLSFKIAEIAYLRNIPTLFTPHNHHIIDPQLYMINENLQKWHNTNFFENTLLNLENQELKNAFNIRLDSSRKTLNDYVDYTLAISNRTKELLIDYGVSANKIKVIHQIPESINYLTTKGFNETKSPLRLGYIGSVITIKGVHNIILAMNEINPELVNLKIYGDGNNDYIENLKKFQRSNNIIWNGRYNYDQLSKIAEEIDVLIMPSIVEEGAGLVLLEALKMGIPVIASRIGGIPDFIIDNYNGMLYQHNSYKSLKSIIEELIENPKLVDKFKMNTKLSQNREDFLIHLTKIYQSLIEKDDFIKDSGNFNIDIFENKIMNQNEENPMNRLKFESDFSNGFANKSATGKMPNPLPNPLLLNLGCGKDVREGFVNIDLFSNDPNVVKMDIRKLNILDSTVDAILASDVLEHFSHRETSSLLSEWNRVLKNGGKLIVRCPSLYLQAKAYMNNLWDADIASYMIFGGQTNPGDYHCIGFDTKSIKNHLEKAGFIIESINEEDIPQDKGFINLNMTVVAVKYDQKLAKDTFTNEIIKEDSNSKDIKISIQPEKPNVIWEGSQFVYHSLALINREHCNNLINIDSYDLTIIPYENDQFNPEIDEKYLKLFDYDIRNKKLDIKPNSNTIWIRHQWPPQKDRPEIGKWVINQPWEYSLIPIEFVNIFNQADEIWTPSNFCRNAFINSGVDFNKVQIVPNGINPKIFKPGKSNFPLKTNKKLKLLFVGGTIYRKGIDILLTAYLKAFTNSDDVTLIIKDMGNSTFYKGQTVEERILEIQKNPGAPEIIYISDSISENEIADLYRACNVFVSPYRGEGFSLPTLEAMACGLPVIVTQGGATEDFVDESVGWKIKSKMISIGNKMDEYNFKGETFLLEPDIDDLISIFNEIYEKPNFNYIKGLNASYKARTMWTWNKATIKLISRLDNLSNNENVKDSEEILEDEYDGYILLGLADEDYFNHNYDEAKELYLLATESNDLDNESKQFAYIRISLIELINNNYFTSEEFFNKAQEVYIHTPDLAYAKVQMLNYQKLWEDVLESVQDLFDNWSIYKYIIRSGFNLDDIFCDTANALFELDYIEDSINIFNEAKKINENNSNIYIGFAKYYLVTEEFDNAKEMLEKALTIDPANKEAFELRKHLG